MIIWISRFTNNVSAYIEKGTKIICVSLLVAMVSIVLYGVFMRYVMLSAVSWAEEAPIYMMIWVTFLAGSVGIKYGIHIGVEVVTRLFPDKPKTVIQIVSNIFILLFLFVLFKQGFTMCAFGFKYQTSISLGISMGWAILAVPVGALLMIVESFRSILTCLEKLFGSADWS